MLKIAVCDDEKYYIEKIEDLLGSYFEDKGITYEVDTYESGISLVEQGEDILEYDVIFLDVNMKELDGIETAKKIRTYSQDVVLVFVTAYLTYSPEGYKVNAIRYLLKDNDGIERAMVECLDTIVSQVDFKEIKQIFEFQEGKKELILDNIIYIESNLHKLIFYVDYNKLVKYYMYKKLDAIEEKIKLNTFCRIHKSYLVNLKYVEDLQRYNVTLTNGQILNVAKARYKEVLNKYILFKGIV